MSETGVPRRAFLRGATAATAISYSRIMGANERVQVGLIGAGERGQYDTGNFVTSGKADVAAVCDIYGVNIDRAMQKWPEHALEREAARVKRSRDNRRDVTHDQRRGKNVSAHRVVAPLEKFGESTGTVELF